MAGKRPDRKQPVVLGAITIERRLARGSDGELWVVDGIYPDGGRKLGVGTFAIVIDKTSNDYAHVVGGVEHQCRLPSAKELRQQLDEIIKHLGLTHGSIDFHWRDGNLSYAWE